MESLDAEQQGLFTDQQRLRENLGKLGDSSEEKGLRRRYVSELESQENRIEDIRAERSKLESELRRLQQELDAMVREIAFEKEL
jgi:septal ring factor EnvC (AmiA/AmiB activator)